MVQNSSSNNELNQEEIRSQFNEITARRFPRRSIMFAVTGIVIRWATTMMKNTWSIPSSVAMNTMNLVDKSPAVIE